MNIDFNVWMYARNDNFRKYVNKYCNKHGYSLNEALSHQMINDVAHYYHNKEQDQTGTCSRESIKEELEPEDKSC